MNNQELFRLFKNSKLAQVATPTSKHLRGPTVSTPTHQVIYTPKESAQRSNFGLKSALPKQIGRSHIAFNDIDNFKNMPDVEKYSGPHYTRTRFQESGIVLKKLNPKQNPLFAWEGNTSLNNKDFGPRDNILDKLNLDQNVSLSEVKKLLAKNPNLYAEFKKWALENSPNILLSKASSTQLDQLLKDLIASSSSIVKREHSIKDLTKNSGPQMSSRSRGGVQGTAGLSFLQTGRLSNTPNGVKHGTIVPGRLLRNGEAAIGGIISRANERTTLLQSNYIRNAPGKHSRQFVLPFKVADAQVTSTGSVRMSVDGVKVGSWMQSSDIGMSSSKYPPSNPNPRGIYERHQDESQSDVITLLNMLSK